MACGLLAVPALAQTASEHQDATRLQPVVVEGVSGDYRTETPSLSKLTEALKDTPQSISTVSARELDERAATELNGALRNVPGISLGAGETSWQGNNLFLRGFPARNDMLLDGVRDFGYYYRDPFNLESIEVLKGPSSVLFGRGSTGGVINQVSKTPTLARELDASVVVGSDETRRGTLDANVPLKAIGPGAAFRLNALTHDSEVADRDGAANDRWGVAPSLALGLGSPTRVSLSYLRQSDDIRPDYGLPWLNGRPAPVKRSNFYGFDSDYLDTRVNIFTAGIEHDVDANTRIDSRLRYSRNTRRFRISEAAIPANLPPEADIDDITVSRNEFEGTSTDRFLQSQTNATFRFDAAGFAHTLVTGVEAGYESPNPVYVTNVGVPGTHLANPDPDQEYSVAQSYKRLSAKTESYTAAAYLLDTIRFNEHWQIMAGLRYDHFDADYRSIGYDPDGQTIATTELDQTDHALSYRAALIYKPIAEATIYLAYGNSFNPSAEGIESLISSGRALGQANLGLDPEKNRNVELGAKWALLDERLLLSSSVFRIEKTNARVPNPDTPGFNALGGDQRVDGIEIEAVGRLSERWNIRSGYTYLDSQTTRSAAGGPVVGKPLLSTARDTASLWTSYGFADFSLGIGALHVSERVGQNTAAAYRTAPGYTTIDAMAKYALSPRVVLQLNAYNLTDKVYFDQLHPFHVVPGPGRYGLLTVNFHYV